MLGMSDSETQVHISDWQQGPDLLGESCSQEGLPQPQRSSWTSKLHFYDRHTDTITKETPLLTDSGECPAEADVQARLYLGLQGLPWESVTRLPGSPGTFKVIQRTWGHVGKVACFKDASHPQNSLGRSHKSRDLFICWWPPRRVDPQGAKCPWLSLKLSQAQGSYCLPTRGAKSWETPQEPQETVQQPPSCFPPPPNLSAASWEAEEQPLKRIQDWAASGGLSCNQGVASSSVEKWVCRTQSK